MSRAAIHLLFVVMLVFVGMACGGSPPPDATGPRPLPPAPPAQEQPPTVLYVESAATQPLADALEREGFDVVLSTPTDLPERCEDLGRFAFVILSGTPPERVPVARQEALACYVDRGGGFLFAAGEHAAAWHGTRLESVLPVEFTASRGNGPAPAAMSVVIDTALRGPALESAKAAARSAADTLPAEALMEVVTVDAAPQRLVPLTPLRDRASTSSPMRQPRRPAARW